MEGCALRRRAIRSNRQRTHHLFSGEETRGGTELSNGGERRRKRRLTNARPSYLIGIDTTRTKPTKRDGLDLDPVKSLTAAGFQPPPEQAGREFSLANQAARACDEGQGSVSSRPSDGDYRLARSRPPPRCHFAATPPLASAAV